MKPNQVINALIIFLCHVTSLFDTPSNKAMAVKAESNMEPRVGNNRRVARYSYHRNLKRGTRIKKHIGGGRRWRLENEKPVRWGPVSLQNAYNSHSRLYPRKNKIVVRKDFVSMGDVTSAASKKMSARHLYRSAMAPRPVGNGAI